MKKILMKKIKHRMCLVFVFKVFWVILGYSKNTHIIYIIIKPQKKANKIFFIIFFSIYKIDDK